VSVLVIGGSGQLGRHLRAELPLAQFWDRSVVDLTDLAGLQRRLDAARPTAIVIAAAYTAVDKAEAEPELAWRVNAEAPAVIARAAQRLDVPLVSVSTDYVFDGCKPDGYTEEDGTRPLGAYGRSKLGGELAVASLCSKYWILRASWVFSEHGHNFVKTMLRLARERDELRVVDDQRGRPTYAGDLARCIVGLLDKAGAGDAPLWGLHHVGGGPETSWRNFAAEIIDRAARTRLIARAPNIARISTSEYPTPAQRPLNSILKTRTAGSGWNSRPFDWLSGLDEVIVALAARPPGEG
jgi:dTDP-4-dehydrorhamnose reductase